MSDITKRTSQYIDNLSFDETYNQQAVEILTENAGGTALERQKTIATEETLQAQLAEYKITDIDDTGYYGYLKADGGWYIMSGIAGAYRYIKGTTDYTTAWSGRAGLQYDYFNLIFN